MAHQTPLGYTMPYTNAGQQQQQPFHYAVPQGGFMLTYPPGLPQHPFAHHTQTPPPMDNPYGQFHAYGVLIS